MGQLPAEGFIPVRLRSAQSMMNMQGGKPDPEYLFQAKKHGQKAYGIRPPAESDKDRIAAAQHAAGPDIFENVFFKLIHPSSFPQLYGCQDMHVSQSGICNMVIYRISMLFQIAANRI